MQDVRHIRRRMKVRQALATIFLVSAGAGAAVAGPLTVCGTYSTAAKGTIEFDISNGCVSSSYRYQGNNIEVSVKEETASIVVIGGFNYQSPKSKVVKRDCGAGQRLKVAVNNVQPRRYSVVFSDRHQGAIDFASATARQCITDRVHGPRSSRGGNRKQLDRLLKVKEGASIQAVLAPLLHGISIEPEGAGSLVVSVRRLLSDSARAKPRAVAEITAHGLADDSVSGLQHTILFEAVPDGWKAISAKSRKMCARGTKAGQWTDANCS